MKPSNNDARLWRRSDAEPDLKELLDDLVIQIMMHYDGVSESEMKDVIDQAREGLSRKAVFPTTPMSAENRSPKEKTMNENQGGPKGRHQPGSVPVTPRTATPTLRNDEKNKRSSPSQASDQQVSEIATAFDESR